MKTASCWVGRVAIACLAVLTFACDSKAPSAEKPPVADNARKKAASSTARATALAAKPAVASAAPAASLVASPSGQAAEAGADAPSKARAEANADGQPPSGSKAVVAAGTQPAVASAQAPEVASAPAATADAPAPEPVAEKAPEPQLGKKATGTPYAAWLQTSGRYVVGKSGSVQAVAVAQAGYKCNAEYPFKFKLGSAPAGLSFPSPIARSLTRGAKRTVVNVPFTPTAAGKQTISGTFYMSVCDDASCVIKRLKLSVTIQVDAS